MITRAVAPAIVAAILAIAAASPAISAASFPRGGNSRSRSRRLPRAAGVAATFVASAGLSEVRGRGIVDDPTPSFQPRVAPASCFRAIRRRQARGTDGIRWRQTFPDDIPGWSLSARFADGEDDDLEEPEDEAAYRSPIRKRPEPRGGDMAYTNENILRQASHYKKIREAGGSNCVLDVYVRDPGTGGDSARFWFVGKVARCTGTVSPESAVARQFRLLEEHACRIRPVELGRSFGSLDFWSAAGDSEVLTSQNDPGTALTKLPRHVEGCENVNLLEIGLNLELVTNRGVGFSITRSNEGRVS